MLSSIGFFTSYPVLYLIVKILRKNIFFEVNKLTVTTKIYLDTLNSKQSKHIQNAPHDLYRFVYFYCSVLKCQPTCICSSHQHRETKTIEFYVTGHYIISLNEWKVMVLYWKKKKDDYEDDD